MVESSNFCHFPWLTGALEASARGGRAGPLHQEHRPPSGTHGAQASDLDQDGLDGGIGKL